jgi:hypothetical protein
MPALDSDNGEQQKQPYTTPHLTVHGSLTDITLLRFNWHPRRPGDWKDDPIGNVS